MDARAENGDVLGRRAGERMGAIAPHASKALPRMYAQQSAVDVLPHMVMPSSAVAPVSSLPDTTAAPGQRTILHRQ
jgi:hypothetical protein